MRRIVTTVVIASGLVLAAASVSAGAATGDVPAARSATASVPDLVPAVSSKELKREAKKWAKKYALTYAKKYAKKYAKTYATSGPAGPKGDPGPAGPRGATGPAGPKGEVGPATSLAGMVFYTPGPACPTGTSAVPASDLTVVTVLGAESYGTATLAACRVG